MLGPVFLCRFIGTEIGPLTHSFFLQVNLSRPIVARWIRPEFDNPCEVETTRSIARMKLLGPPKTSLGGLKPLLLKILQCLGKSLAPRPGCFHLSRYIEKLVHFDDPFKAF